MTRSDTQHLYSAALALANKVRAKLGLKPATHLAKGELRDIYACPISSTIQGRSKRLLVSTGMENVRAHMIGGKKVLVAVTPDAFDFIERFDDGQFPELIR